MNKKGLDSQIAKHIDKAFRARYLSCAVELF